MLNVVKIISSEIERTRRFLKFLRFGKRDIQTSYEAMPYGVDSVPIAGIQAIYGKTASNGKSVIIGYINLNQIAKEGEHKIFATDKDGNEQLYLHLKNDGTAEFGGKNDNLVRYIPLNIALTKEVTDINIELGKIAVAINAIVPGSYIPTPISADFSGSKISEIKTL